VKNFGGESIGSNRDKSLIRRIQCLLQEGWNVNIQRVYRETKKWQFLMGCPSDEYMMFWKKQFLNK
jgi:hypothetical protein